MTDIRPQPGPQESFLGSSADIVIYGGEVGGGKTFGLLMEPLRHLRNAKFGAVFFRRESVQIKNEGGPWDTACELYSQLGARLIFSDPPAVRFPSGAKITFKHLQHEADAYKWDGAQIALACWDELTTFTEKQFWYLQSRMRSTCGVRPYTRATCNPVPADDPVGGWVNRIVTTHWVDPETGYAIPERSGDVRWFYRVNDELRWYETAEEAREANPEQVAKGIKPTSLAFIHASLDDNPALLDADPDYRSRVESLSLVERLRKMGNWKIRETAGNMFRAGWISDYLDQIPVGSDVTKAVRFWDEASSKNKGADWTVGSLLLKRGEQRIIADVRRGQWTPEERIRQQIAAAEFDRNLFGPGRCELLIEREGGSSGITASMYTGDRLAKFSPRFKRPDTNKVERARPLSSAMERGAVVLVRGGWNAALISEMENFPSKGWHDDQVDACSGGFTALLSNDTPSPAPMGQRGR